MFRKHSPGLKDDFSNKTKILKKQTFHKWVLRVRAVTNPTESTKLGSCKVESEIRLLLLGISSSQIVVFVLPIALAIDPFLGPCMHCHRHLQFLAGRHCYHYCRCFGRRRWFGPRRWLGRPRKEKLFSPRRETDKAMESLYKALFDTLFIKYVILYIYMRYSI